MATKAKIMLVYPSMQYLFFSNTKSKLKFKSLMKTANP